MRKISNFWRVFTLISMFWVGQPVWGFDWPPGLIGQKNYESIQAQCNEIYDDAEQTCQLQAGSDPSEQCNLAKQSQGYTQCSAFMQTSWSIFFTYYMMFLDAAAFSTCLRACVGLIAAPESPTTATAMYACNATGTADALGDFTDQKILGAKMGQSFMGSSFGSQAGTALGLLGIGMGVAGMAP